MVYWKSQFLISGSRLVGLLLCCCLIAILAGCSDDGAQQKLDFGRQTVERGLESWKSGQTAVALKSAEPSVEFYDDDWNRSAKLLSYAIGQMFIERSDGTARCSVTLNVKYGEKKPKEVTCTYQIVTEPKVIVARDPMS